MRKILLLTFVLLLAVTGVQAQEVKQESQNFEVIFKVKYNSISLERAAQLEKLIKQFCKDACKVTIEIGKVEQTSNVYRFTNNGLGTIDWDNYIDTTLITIDPNSITQ